MSKDRNVHSVNYKSFLLRAVILNFRVNLTNQACRLFNKDNAEFERIYLERYK